MSFSNSRLRLHHYVVNKNLFVLILIFRILEMKPNNLERSQNSRRKRNNLNRKIRLLSCWNCFQLGHVRFQCPFPKNNICSFCRRPGIRSCDCSCAEARRHFSVLNNRPPFGKIMAVLNNIQDIDVSCYNPNVMIPISGRYEEEKNIVVVIENDLKANIEEDRDVIDIFAEDDDLAQI
jgi:hypothetical protein